MEGIVKPGLHCNHSNWPKLPLPSPSLLLLSPFSPLLSFPPKSNLPPAEQLRPLYSESQLYFGTVF